MNHLYPAHHYRINWIFFIPHSLILFKSSWGWEALISEYWLYYRALCGWDLCCNFPLKLRAMADTGRERERERAWHSTRAQSCLIARRARRVRRKSWTRGWAGPAWEYWWWWPASPWPASSSGPATPGGWTGDSGDSPYLLLTHPVEASSPSHHLHLPQQRGGLTSSPAPGLLSPLPALSPITWISGQLRKYWIRH